tara:strand:- start:1391 stop:1993 length:603 start_codon:yes stop_codon:yes gene_type:complete
MDNSVTAYTLETDSSEESDSSDSSNEGNLLSNNLGVLNQKFEIKDERFLNQEKVEDYQKIRNQLFTPEIRKRYFTVKLNASSTSFSLKNTIKLPTNNIIGLKMIKSNFVGDGTNHYTDLSIPEIPDIACDRNDTGQKIFSRIPLRKLTSDFYTHQYLELSLIDRYFYPMSLDNLTFQLQPVVSGFVVIEVAYLNEKVHNN